MKPDPRVLHTLDLLSAWLKAHASALGGSALGGPVAAEDVSRAEQLLGTSLPADYLTFLSRHDGQGLVPAGAHAQASAFVRGLELLPLKSALSEHRGMMEDWDEEGPGDMEAHGPVRAVYKHERWLPIVLLFGASDFLCLDLDPAPGGTPGQVIRVSDDDDRREVVAPSFAVFLERLTEALRSPETVVEQEAELPERLFGPLIGSR